MRNRLSKFELKQQFEKMNTIRGVFIDVDDCPGESDSHKEYIFRVVERDGESQLINEKELENDGSGEI